MTKDDTEDLVLSARVGDSNELFPDILDLHVEDGARIVDVTHGKGVFWRDVELQERDFTLHTSDISPKKDNLTAVAACQELPFKDKSFDCVVLDPPYAEGYYRRHEDHLAGHGSHGSFREAYSNSETYNGSGKYHQAVLNVYFRGGEEAKRILRDDGTLIIKIQDEVSANTQELSHIQVTRFYEDELDFYSKDLFVQVREEVPFVSGMNKQVHARKNHSYFMVFEMTN